MMSPTIQYAAFVYALIMCIFIAIGYAHWSYPKSDFARSRREGRLMILLAPIWPVMVAYELWRIISDDL